jgi:hypothetical protein
MHPIKATLSLTAVALLAACTFDAAGIPPSTDQPTSDSSPTAPAPGVDGQASQTTDTDGGLQPSDLTNATDAELDSQRDAQSPAKVTVCHKGKTTQVDATAVSAHQKHGDLLGSCTSPL